MQQKSFQFSLITGASKQFELVLSFVSQIPCNNQSSTKNTKLSTVITSGGEGSPACYAVSFPLQTGEDRIAFMRMPFKRETLLVGFCWNTDMSFFSGTSKNVLPPLVWVIQWGLCICPSG